MTAATDGCGRGVAVNDRRYGRVRTGRRGADGKARGVGDAAPYGRVQAGIADGGVPSLRRDGPGFVIASQCAHWRGNP